MYYFKQEEGIIKKYEVEFDKEEMEKLKNEIIYNCSEITHKEYKSDYAPRFREDNYKVINYNQTPTKDVKEYWEETRRIYQYSYDILTYPYLVKLIEKLLNGKAMVLEKISEINYKKEKNLKEYFEKNIKELSKKIDDTPNDKIEEKQKLLNKLKELLDKVKLNENQKSIEPYYQKVQDLINLKYIDELSIDEINRVNNFFGKDENEKIIAIDENNSRKQ